MEAADVEEREEEQEEVEEEEIEDHESHEEPDEPEEPEENPEEPKEEPEGEPKQHDPEKESLTVPVIEPGMAQTRTGPVTFQKASVIVGKAIAKAMARESSVRDVHSPSRTPELPQEAPMATPESSEGEEEEMQGRLRRLKARCYDLRQGIKIQYRIMIVKVGCWDFYSNAMHTLRNSAMEFVYAFSSAEGPSSAPPEWMRMKNNL